MSLHSVADSTGLSISVQGHLQTPAEREQFFELVQMAGNQSVTIHFFEAKILPFEACEFLKAMVTQGHGKVRIQVFHRYLASYLFRLGIPNQMVQQQSLGHPVEKPLTAIAIGGSAGSLDKIIEVVSRLPARSISLFIVQHIPENEPNYLSDILKGISGYAIPDLREGMPVQPGCIYIAPPGRHLLVEKGLIHLSQAERVNFARPSIDLTLQSLARHFGEGLVGVLLCGYGQDGTASIGPLKNAGAVTIIEDPLECEAFDMPLNAWKTGQVDYKFPLPEITSYLVRRLDPEMPAIGDRELTSFLEQLHQRYGYDYRHYSQASALRRISRVMADHRIYSFKRFVELTLNDRDLFENLFLECSINVTEFFRNPGIFHRIRHSILPYLNSFPHLRIWSAGCSTGQEALSLAILLEEQGMLQKSRIFASDINPLVVEEAQNGLYPETLIRQCEESYLRSGGTRSFQDYFQIRNGIARINPSLKERILFFQHSLLNKGSFNEFHLILCRNVLIYFDQTLQREVLDLFSRSIDMNGFLILGESESISHLPLGFEPFDKQAKIFKKVI